MPVSTGRHVMITGASSGIGYSLARDMAARGWRVSALARRQDRLTALAAETGQITPLVVDVRDHAQLKTGVNAAIAAYGPVDLAVLNAGIYQPVRADEFDLSVYHDHMSVNYFGILNCLDLLLDGMLARASGHIALMGSVAGYRGLPRAAAYGPSKAAIQNLAECLYFDLQPKGVKIQLINPGFVDTEATAVNDFVMPGLMTADAAARALYQGLMSDRFEIVFPRSFVRKMKWLRLLPYSQYLKLVARMTGNRPK